MIPEGPDRLELQRDLERVLYHDQEAAEIFFKEVRVGFAVEEGSDMQFVRVLPSYLDRKPFFELLIEGRIGKDLNSSSSEEESSVISLQKDAKRWFDSQVEHLVAKYRVVHVVMHSMLLTSNYSGRLLGLSERFYLFCLRSSSKNSFRAWQQSSCSTALWKCQEKFDKTLGLT